MAKPHAKVVSEVCSLCGLDWARHGANPTAEGCVKLLLDEVSTLNARLAHRPLAYPVPYVPTPSWPRPYFPVWYQTIAASSTAPGRSYQTLNAVNVPSRPRAMTITSGH